jgi:hypothetical protein
VQDRAKRARGLGDADRFLQLAEDLRLAEHHRIEPGRDAKRVAHGLLARQRVEIWRKLVGPKPMVFREPRGRGLRLARRHVDLGAITGRKDRCFRCAAPAHKLPQRTLERVRRECDPLADFERRGRVVQSEGE